MELTVKSETVSTSFCIILLGQLVFLQRTRRYLKRGQNKNLDRFCKKEGKTNRHALKGEIQTDKGRRAVDFDSTRKSVPHSIFRSTRPRTCFPENYFFNTTRGQNLSKDNTQGRPTRKMATRMQRSSRKFNDCGLSTSVSF